MKRVGRIGQRPERGRPRKRRTKRGRPKGTIGKRHHKRRGWSWEKVNAGVRKGGWGEHGKSKRCMGCDEFDGEHAMDEKNEWMYEDMDGPYRTWLLRRSTALTTPTYVHSRVFLLPQCTSTRELIQTYSPPLTHLIQRNTLSSNPPTSVPTLVQHLPATSGSVEPARSL